MTRRIRALIVFVALGWGSHLMLHDASAAPFLLAQKVAPTATPIPAGSPPPSSPPPQGSPTVPVVQKSYLFELFYVPLLIVLALTAICRSSNRS